MRLLSCFCTLALILSAALTFAAEPSSQADHAKQLGIQLEAWHCVGPFKESLFGDVLKVFEKPYLPEKAALAAGRDPADLSKAYQVEALPGMLQTVRRWQRHEQWVDGYRHMLPRGPAPSRSEAVYLYRTIRAERDITLRMQLFAEDCIRVWLNGKPVGEAHRRCDNFSRFPSALSAKLPLLAGENRLLVKVASIHAAHGFSFSLPSLHPSNSILPGKWASSMQGRYTSFSPLDQPIISEAGPRLEYASSDDPARKYRHALRRIRAFKTEWRPTPMYDPPESPMVEMLDKLPPSVLEAREYVLERRAVDKQIRDALALVDAEDPGAEAAVLAANGAIERMWKRQIDALGPVIFVRHPACYVNGVAPYSKKSWGNPSFLDALPASICVVDPAEPKQPARVLVGDPNMSIYDMNLSWDAKTVFFSAFTDDWHWQLYEAPTGTTPAAIKRITHNDEADFISPVELPDGRLMFVSTQANTWVQCQTEKSGLLYSCARDGSDMRKLSGNIDSDHYPQVTDDGRILFTRWDYGIEKNVFARHALWTMNPDGIGLRLFFGNTIEDPAGFWKARPIAGRPEVVCAFGAHHDNQTGMLGVVWSHRGPEAPRGEGFRFITDEIPSYCDTNCGHSYQDPFPLHERLFLVSFGGDGGKKNRIYLIDELGNRKCIYEAAGNRSCFYPIPLRPRPRPPVIVPQSEVQKWVYREPEEMNNDPDDLWGALAVADVYRGISDHIERGRAKSIQVIEQVQKSRPMTGGDPAWGHTPIMGRGTVHVRRVIGTAAIHEDGSAHFRVPGLRSISLNVLDEEGRTLMRMGSDMHVMPGETQSCIGCHENRYGAVAPDRQLHTPTAAADPPVMPQPAGWGTDGLLDYQQVVQPVWDKYCIECHGGPTPDAGLSLVGDRTRFFCVSYDNLVDRGLVDFTNVFAIDHDENTPLTLGAIVSPLREFIETEHAGRPPLSREDRYRVYAWIDANVPYYSTYVSTRAKTPGGRDGWDESDGKERKKCSGWIVDHVARVFDRRCMSCHKRTVHNQGLWSSPKITVSSRHWTHRGVTAHGFPVWVSLTAKYGPEFRINLTRPSHSLMLNAPLAKEAGGLGYCKLEDGLPVFADTEDVDYRHLLGAIETGKAALYAMPRVDMPAKHVEGVLPSVLPEEELALYLAGPPAQMPKGWKPPASIPAGTPNLARGATPDSPDDVPLDKGKPGEVTLQGAIDGNMESIWDDVDKRPAYRYRLTFPQSTRISAISLAGWAHHDFAPRSFEILCDGKSLGRIEDARYRKNRLLLALPPTECKMLELHITETYGGSPAIRELELFDLKAP